MSPDPTESYNGRLPGDWGSSSGLLQPGPPPLRFHKIFRIAGNTPVESCVAHDLKLTNEGERPVRVRETGGRWKAYLFILINVNEFYYLSKCYQHPSEMSSLFFFFPGEGSEGREKWMLKTDCFDLKWKQTTLGGIKKKKKGLHCSGDLGILADTFMN